MNDSPKTRNPHSAVVEDARARSQTAVSRQALDLTILEGTFAICRLDPGGRIPSWVLAAEGFVSIARTPEEISVVCEERHVPEEVRAERGWRVFKVAGPLDFALVGVVGALAQPLAKARISVLVVSTFDTDYLLVRAWKLEKAVAALAGFGHRVVGGEKEGERDLKDGRDEEEEKAQEVEAEEAEEVEAGEAEAGEAEEIEEIETAAMEPLPAPEAFDEDDELAMAEGLYTGAIPQHAVETIDQPFESLGLSGPILQTVRTLGFVYPTPIQAAVIPHALARRDVIGLAETGSGKTAAFVLPMAEHLTHSEGIRGVILCPTREIALQTKAFLDLVGRYHSLVTVCIIGGVRMGPQIDGLKRRPDIVVATPGRLYDHLERGTVRLDLVEKLVLDEADHMLDLGFLPQIQRILRKVPADRQTMMFSATMPPAIERLAEQFMLNPLRLDFRPETRFARGIEHRVYLVKESDKKACLLALVDQVPGSTLVFTRRRLDAEWVSRMLEASGHAVERIHSDLTQGQRVKALRGFREEQHRILVATDVAARGIDIPVIRHVVNFELPDNVEDYVHRAGRTARGAALGIVSSIATWLDKSILQEIEDLLGEKIQRYELPGVQPYREIRPRQVIRRRLL